MKRRNFLKTISLSGLAIASSGCQYIPRYGFFNPCHETGLPPHLANHELVQETWQGIDTNQVWDCHTHLIGMGDSDSGIWLNPDMKSLLHPIFYTKFKFYINGSCAIPNNSETFDEAYVNRLVHLHESMPPGFRFCLLGFDYYYTEKGKVNKDYSTFYTPNDYAAKIAKKYPNQFEWIASIHPYREDALEALEFAVKNNARAVKWLPSAMGITPDSKLCDEFYEALVKHNMPLLTHVGAEQAVEVPGGERNENPLLFRGALDHGVRVVFAHCATLGESIDLDKGKNGPYVANLDLFARMMAEVKYENLLYGDLSAITQVNRDKELIEKIVTNEQWHSRLLYGSDYPLPGVMPVFSPHNFSDWGFLPEKEADVLAEIREYNPILFDLMLKRRIKINGAQFSTQVFESKRFFVS
ncbi:MAG: amidohydrolase family protein [Gammaproteobacteria bacterium]